MRQMQNVLDSLVTRLSPQEDGEQDAQPPGKADELTARLPEQTDEQIWSGTNPIRVESPHTRGPTSTEFTLDVVKRGFKAMGYDSTPFTEATQASAYPYPAPGKDSAPIYRFKPALRVVMDNPLWQLGRIRALQLTRSYINGPGAMYPVLHAQDLIDQVETLFSAVQHVQDPGASLQKASALEFLLSHSPTTLQLVLAIGLTLEKLRSDHIMYRLYDDAQEELTRGLWDTSATLQSVICLALAVSY